MKRSKFLVLALVAVLMTVGLIFTGCRPGCEGAGTCKTTKDTSKVLRNQKGSSCTNAKCATNNKYDAECDC
jgi:hypothetical protein